VETSLGSGIGDGWQMVPLFTVEEVLFNLAEAYTYTGQTNRAIGLLNVYLSTRISQYNPATDNINENKIKSHYNVSDIKVGLINTLLDYRRIEFIHEGMRWFDVLRYGIEVAHNTIGGTPVTLTKDDPHRVFQIPPTAVALSGIPLNPR
jgi:hypothetical protein